MAESYKAFVSSTFEDLKEHRRVVIEELRRAGIHVDPMEDWVAAPNEPRDFCPQRVEGCDLCILLVAFRRGFVPPGESRSITQMEYDFARDHDIDVLVFLLDDEAPWYGQYDERRVDEAINAWRDELQLAHGVQFFGIDPTSIDVAAAIARWLPRPRRPTGAGNEGESPAPRRRIVGFRPEGADSFYDREEPLRQLKALFEERHKRFICITGRGGIGKTALLSRVCLDIEEGEIQLPNDGTGEGVEGIVYVNCRVAQSPLIHQLCRDFGRLLGKGDELTSGSRDLQQGSVDEIVRYLLDQLGDHRYLLVLDNLESFLTPENRLSDESLEALLRIWSASPSGLRMLATSRQVVSLGPESLRFVRVVPLEAGLPEADGIALLRDFDATGKLSRESETLLAETVRRCHGQPKALVRIAGMLYDDFTLSLGRLLENDALFDEGVVENLFEEHYRRLQPGQRFVVEALAAFEKPATLEQLTALVRTFRPEIDVPEHLRGLASNYFVKYVESKETFELHPLDQNFVYNHLGREDEGARLADLHAAAADWFAGQRLPRESWKSLDDLQPQLEEIQHRIRAGQFDEAAEVLNEIDLEYLENWGYAPMVIQWRTQLDGRLTRPILQQLNTGNLGTAYQWTGNDDAAMRHLETALDRSLWGDRWDPSLPAGLWKALLARANIRRGNIPQATQLAKEAIDEAASSREAVCLALSALGIAHRRMGELQTADEYYERALTVAQETQNRYLECQIRNNRGVALLVSRGDVEPATAEFQRAWDIAHDIGAKLVEACAEDGLAVACFRRGHLDEAARHFEQAIVKSKVLDLRGNLSFALDGLGTVQHLRGERDEARGHYLEGHTLGVPETQYRLALKLGILCRESQDDAGAGRYLRQAQSLCEQLVATEQRDYEARYFLGHVHLALGDDQAAMEAYRAALDVCSEPGARQGALATLDLLSRVLDDSERIAQVRRLLESDGDV